MGGSVSDDAILFHRPSMGRDEEEAVLEVLRSGWLTTGPKVKEFEAGFAAFRGAAHAVAMNSCTAAMHVALKAMGVGPGDEVVTTPITFASTANVIVHVGATPVFCDVEPDTLNMDPDSLREAITERTRAVMPVHFAGHPCEMEPICEVASEFDLGVIEDCAHALEASIRGRAVGSFGDAAAYSFYATKNITTGEGGMLTTSNVDLADAARILSLHGISRDAWKRYGEEGYKHWDIVDAGFKYNMSDIQAALGIAQLARVGEFLERRRLLVERYDEAFGPLPGLAPLRRRDHVAPSYHLFVLQVMPESGIDRDSFIEEVQARGVNIGVHFRAVHLHPFYRETFGFEPGALPVAEAAGDRVVSLPLYPDLADELADRVIDVVKEVVERS